MYSIQLRVKEKGAPKCKRVEDKVYRPKLHPKITFAYFYILDIPSSSKNID